MRCYFACEFLWTAFSLHEALLEDQPGYAQAMSKIFLSRWSDAYAALTHWALEARFYPLDLEQAGPDERQRLLEKADALSDPAMFRWYERLITAAAQAHHGCPPVEPAVWLYYGYCCFLKQVLAVFEQFAGMPDSGPSETGNFQERNPIFARLSGALEKELDRFGQTIRQHAYGETGTAAAQALAVLLGNEWREAVLSAAVEA